MKHRNILLLCLFFVAMVACKPSAQKNDSAPEIVVSVAPQKFLAERIVAGRFVVNVLLPEGSNPETFDPTPRQILASENAKIAFLIGAFPFENQWEKSLKTNHPETAIFRAMDAVSAVCDNQPEHQHECQGHTHADPHIWTSPKLMRTMAQNMCEQIAQLDSANANFYRQNLASLIGEINRTDSTVRNILASAKSHSFLVYHPALSYFALDYGLTQLAIEHDGKNPSPERLQKLIETARKEGVRTVLMQPEFDRKNAETIAKEIGAKTVEITPLSADWSAEMVRMAHSIAQP